PHLFNLAVADFKVAEHPSDVVLHDQQINTLMQADDIGMGTTSASSLQPKLRQFEDYAARTGFEVSIPKCMIAVFGKDTEPTTTFLLHGKELQKKTEMKYIGVHHQTGRGSMYNVHYETYAKKAKNVAGAVLHAKTFVGKDIPLW
ncbi:hypothetical protein EV359DRAFT_14709, partial [Lentinula novae-zelandiae]